MDEKPDSKVKSALVHYQADSTDRTGAESVQPDKSISPSQVKPLKPLVEWDPEIV